MAAQLKPGEETLASMTEPRFRPKEGSVFPVKKKLVKSLIFESIVGSSRSKMPKEDKIFPDPDGFSPDHRKSQQE